MRALLSGGPFAGLEIVVGDSCEAVTMPHLYAGGRKAIELRYELRHGRFEYVGEKHVEFPELPRFKRVVSLFERARKSAALVGR